MAYTTSGRQKRLWGSKSKDPIRTSTTTAHSNLHVNHPFFGIHYWPSSIIHPSFLYPSSIILLVSLDSIDMAYTMLNLISSIDPLSTLTATTNPTIPCAINHDDIRQFPPASAFIVQSTTSKANLTAYWQHFRPRLQCNNQQ